MNNDQIKAFVEKVIEIQDLTEKLKQWEECADKLIVYAEEIKCTIKNQALYEAVSIDIEQYKKLKTMCKHTDCEDEDCDKNAPERKDRNLFSELKEGIDELEKRRLKKDLDVHGKLE